MGFELGTNDEKRRVVTGTEMRAKGLALYEALDESGRVDLVCETGDGVRFEWGYSPPRTTVGLGLASFDPDQRGMLHAFLATGLSTRGYATAVVTMALDDILFLESGGSVVERNPLGYYLTFFGRPDNEKWAWRFQGHHLSINYTLSPDGVVAGSPLFIGVNPQSIESDGRRGFQLLTEERVEAVALLESLDGEQRERAVLDLQAPLDVVTRNTPMLSEEPFRHPDPSFLLPPEERLASLDMETRQYVEGLFRPVDPMSGEHTEAVAFTWEPKGVPASELSRAQRDALWRLIEGYAGRWPATISRDQLSRIDSAFEKTYFAWAGDPRARSPYYYRLQGPTFLVEYDTPLGDPRHVHTVWRDPEGDFGGDLLAAHTSSPASEMKERQ